MAMNRGSAPWKTTSPRTGDDPATYRAWAAGVGLGGTRRASPTRPAGAVDNDGAESAPPGCDRPAARHEVAGDVPEGTCQHGLAGAVKDVHKKRTLRSPCLTRQPTRHAPSCARPAGRRPTSAATSPATRPGPLSPASSIPRCKPRPVERVVGRQPADQGGAGRSDLGGLPAALRPVPESRQPQRLDT